MMKKTCHPILLLILLTALNCGIGNQSVSIRNDLFQIEFNPQMKSRIVAFRSPSSIEIGDFRPSEYLLLNSGPLDEFEITHSESGTTDSPYGLGKVEYLTLRGVAEGIEKEVQVNLPEEHPSTAVFLVKYTNQGSESVAVQGWVNNHYQMNPSEDSGSETPFWAYQSASYEDRRDWIRPLKPGFSQENYLGMNASDYGGGTPVVDIWRKDVGMAVGHLMDSPKLNSLPIQVNASGVAEISVQYQQDRTLEPGESMTTFLTFVMVHSGDYFTPLREYRRLMEQTLKKVRFDPYPESAYQPVWCAWGYERSFTMEQVYGTLPKAEELGFKWAVLDDGWQTSEGDWYLKKDKFPRGDRDMKRLTSQIRKSGMRPKLWWVP
jgi:alpha-galactosidase